MNLEKLAGCLIIENRKVLLVKEKKDWYWKIPSGKVKDRESLRGCAIRETREEAGVDVEILSLFGDYSFNFKNREFYLEVYRAKIVDGTPHPNEEHLENVGWFPIESLNLNGTTPSNKLIYNDLVKKK